MKNMKTKNKNFPAKMIDAACDVSGFCSKDESRGLLKGIHFTENTVEATDGLIAIVLPYPELETAGFPSITGTEDNMIESVLPADEVTKALNNIPKKSNYAAIKAAKLNAKGDDIQISTTNLDNQQTVNVKTITGDYPDLEAYEAELWQGEAAKFNIHLSGAVLKKLIDYVGKHGQKRQTGIFKNYTPIKFSFYDDLSAVKVSFQLEDDREAKVFFMPCRAQ